MSEFEREFDWGEEITAESEYTLLPEGDYDFEVTKFERGRTKSEAKIPNCNMAILTLRVTDGKDTTTVIDYLTLHSKMEWKLSQFFLAIGLKKHGEPLRMDWSKVLGAKGRCKLIVDKYTTDKGENRETNKISKYYDYVQPSAPAKTKWSAGDF